MHPVGDDGVYEVWEKGLVIGTGVLFTVFAPVAALAFMGGDGEDGAVVSVATSTPVVIIYDGPTPTITPQPTSTPKALAPTRTPKPPNREDCDAIQGTTYQSDDVGIRLLDILGEDNVMWGSDFPHPDGVWPDSQEFIKNELRDLAPEIRDKIVCGNAARLYGFQV